MTRRITDPHKLADRLIDARAAVRRPLTKFCEAIAATANARGMTARERKALQDLADSYAMDSPELLRIVERLRRLGGEQ